MDNSLKFIIFCFSLTFILACKQEPQKTSKKVFLVENLQKVSSGWKLEKQKDKKGSYRLVDIHKKGLRAGETVLLEFGHRKYIKYVQLIGNNKIRYRLFFNEKYAGKYRANEKIGLNREIHTLRILVDSSGNEKRVEGWDEKFDYKYVIDTIQTSESQAYLEIAFDGKNKEFINPIPKRKQEMSHKATFVNKRNSLVLKNKKTKDIVNQTVNFSSGGSFFIHFLKIDHKKKAFEYFYSGWWKLLRKKRSSYLLELKGQFAGQGAVGSNFEEKEINQQVFIDSLNRIRAKGFLDGVLIDLPNTAMINLKDVNDDFIIDIPYSTTKNITGKKLYSCNECYLRYQTIKDLLKVQKDFAELGFKIKLLDCYRPFFIQKILYDAFPVSGYVADPVGGSIHNRGTAVDLTLVDRNGNELDMGSEYDELSVRSNHGYIGFPDTVLQNRKLLRETMNANNFVTIRLEWWHYNHQYARRQPKMNDEFPCATKKTEKTLP